MESISGYKDTDREILLNLSDKDLLIACSTNKYFYNNVCDDNFFHKKLLRSYTNTLKYKDQNTNYKQYYLKVVYYISKLKEKFDYSYSSGDPEKQYKIFENSSHFLNKDESFLWQASREGEIELVKEAIKKGGDIYDALTIASENGHLEIIKYLVSLGADISIEDDHPLRWASYYGHLEVVKYLLSLGANISTRENDPLRQASKNGHLEVVKYLVNNGADISAGNGADISAGNGAALKWAREKGQLDVVEYLKSLA